LERADGGVGPDLYAGETAGTGRRRGGRRWPGWGRELDALFWPGREWTGSERRLPALVRAGKEAAAVAPRREMSSWGGTMGIYLGCGLVGLWPPFYVYVRGGMEVVRFFLFNSLLFFRY
jgi:hypothetical protein